MDRHSSKLRMIHRCLSYRFKSEVASIRLLRRAKLDGGTLLDIGANRGIYSIYMSRAAGPEGRVIAFEPQPELDAHLNRVKRNFGLKNTVIVNSGLSSEKGTLRLQRRRAGHGGASFHHAAVAELEDLDVPVSTLDEYVANNVVTDIRFVKCDVERHEFDVFRGGEQTLRRDLPVLLFECGHEIAREGRLFDFLCSLGYDGFFFYVSQADHLHYWTKGRGKYVHYSEFADYEYCRPEINFRNYVFLRRGLMPESIDCA